MEILIQIIQESVQEEEREVLQREYWSELSPISSFDDTSSRAFAKEGYSVALIARNTGSLKACDSDLKSSGIDVGSFYRVPLSIDCSTSNFPGGSFPSVLLLSLGRQRCISESPDTLC